MSTLPRLLETYEEARLLLEAKGWGIAKAAEHLSELPGMARFHISQTKLSLKSKPGAANAIEPEVAAAVEGMETRRGYERQTEIVTAGLLARHSARPPPASQRMDQRAFKLLRSLAERLGRAFWTRIAITAASGALVACLALPLVAPFLPGRANAAQPGPLMVMIFGPGADDAPVRFDPGAILATPVAWGEKPLDQPIPKFTLPGQKVAPCDAGLGQVEINGNCWARMADVKPPCGRLFRREDSCYIPVAAEPKKPAP